MSSNASLLTRSGHALWPALASARTTVAALNGFWPWLLALLMFLSGSLAYLAPFRFDLKIGGLPPITAECYSRVVRDAAYLEGFNRDPEFNASRAECATATVAYRWAFSEARVRLPGIGRAPLSVTLQVTRGQPKPVGVPSGWIVNNTPLVAVPVEERARAYHLLVPLQSPDLDLQFHTPAFQAPNDPRDLAFAAQAIAITPLARVWPAWTLVAMLSVVVGLSYVALRRAAVPTRLVLPLCLLLIGALGALLAWQRLPLTLIVGRGFVLFLAGIGIGAVLHPIAATLARKSHVVAERVEIRLIVLLIVLAWLIRTVALLHPQTLNSDIGLNINNLVSLIQGEIIFTEGLPDDAGGGRAPYPPAQYIMLAPWTLLGLEKKTLIIVGNALADSLVILWLWLLLRSGGLGRTPALFAGLVYLFAAPLLRSLSIGEMANVWGQALIAPWLLTLVLWRQGLARNLVLAIVTAIALLGHFGVLMSALLFGGTLGVIWLLRRDPCVWRYILIGGCTLFAVIALYYSDATLVRTVLDRPAAPPPAMSLQWRFGYQIAQLVTPSGVIGPLLAGLGLAGLGLSRKRAPLLHEMLLALWVSVALSWATLLFSQQALRWPAFLMPAIALGGGVALAAIWQRSQVRHLATLITVSVMLSGGYWWLQQVITYGH